MTNVIYNVRGGLGTQVLSLFAAYAAQIQLRYDKPGLVFATPIDTIILNKGGYPAGVLDVGTMFFEDVVEFVDHHYLPKYSVSDGTDKLSSFREPNISNILNHWVSLSNGIVRKKSDITPNGNSILHVRQIDRPLVSMSIYRALYRNNHSDYIVITDSEAVRHDFGGHMYTAIADWRTLINAKSVLGGYSTFTLLAGMLNRDLEVNIICKEQSVQKMMAPEDWSAVDRYVEAFDNINWVTI